MMEHNLVYTDRLWRASFVLIFWHMLHSARSSVKEMILLCLNLIQTSYPCVKRHKNN